MPPEFTDEQDSLRKVVRDFAEREIAPHAERWDAEHTFPTDVVLAMGELGLFGIPFPEEYGGAGGDLTSLCIAIEELGRVDQSLAITLEAGVGLGANPIFRFGTEEQRQTWLPDLCAGRSAGRVRADRARRRQRRRRHPHLGPAGGRRGAGEWVIDGEKAFITNSGTPITSLITVTARTGAGGAGPPEISSILVPAGTPGLTVQPPYRKMGWHASDTHGLSFAGCRVPAANLLGGRGRGLAPVPPGARRGPHRDRRPGRRRHPLLRRVRRRPTPVSARRSGGRSGPTRRWPSPAPTSA